MPSGPLFLPLVIASALLMENIDSTVIATSLPAIAVDLHVNPINLKLAFTSYLLTLAVLIPISGWCADRFGSRTVFRAAIAVFTLGSIACGFTNTLFGFVAARALQGAGGAMMVPVGRLIILRTVPKSDLVRALTYLTLPALIGPVFGPMLGGFITTYFHWRWIFWINVPIGFLGIALATRFIPDLREDDRPPLDLIGFVLSGLGLSTLVFGLTAAGGQVMPTLPDAGLILLGAVLMALYIRHAAHHDAPILDLRLLSLRTYRTSVIGGFFFRAGVGAIPFVLPMMLQVGFGLTPFESGSLTFASAAGALCMKFTAGPILRRLGFRNVLVSNAVISALIPRRLGAFRGDDAASFDLRRASHGRVLPLAAIHEPQCDRLCGCAARRDEPRIELLERLAAALGLGRDRLRGLGAARDADAAPGPCHPCRRFQGRLRARRLVERLLDLDEFPPAPRCRHGGVGLCARSGRPTPRLMI